MHKSDQGAAKLFDVFDKLEEEFGAPDDFALTEAEVDEMYDMIVMDEKFSMHMEGEMIENFEDLKKLM